jgi:hypothetical protein
MRICWFNDNRLGVVEGDRVRDTSIALEGLPKPAYPFPPKGDPLIANLDRLKPAILAAAEGGASFPVGEVRFVSTVDHRHADQLSRPRRRGGPAARGLRRALFGLDRGARPVPQGERIGRAGRGGAAALSRAPHRPRDGTAILG